MIDIEYSDTPIAGRCYFCKGPFPRITRGEHAGRYAYVARVDRIGQPVKAHVMCAVSNPEKPLTADLDHWAGEGKSAKKPPAE